MRIERVVVNASPLIVLFRSGQIELLPRLFHEILVPDSVWREVTSGGHDDPAARGLAQASWTQRIAVDPSERVTPWNLGPGESAVLSLALARSGYRAVMDDWAARRCARTLGIRTLGSGGVLVVAKRRGLISSVVDRLERLRRAGLWISDEVIELLCKQAYEPYP